MIHRFCHVPNETPTSQIQARRLKLMGVAAGVPDYFVLFGQCMIAIELKRRSETAVPSGAQLDWLEDLAVCGVQGYVCHGAREAIALVKDLLQMTAR